MNLQYEPALVYAECPNLTNVNIPANVNGLGVYTFAGCENIESINLTNNIKYIGDYSFVDCISLTAITMPDEIEYLGEGVLNNCKSLEGIYGEIASEDHRCIVQEGTLVAFAPANLIEFTLTSDIINIPQGVFLGVTQGRIIIEDKNWIETDYDYGENWLYGAGFEEIIIPEDTEYLGQNVFCKCYNLKTYTIPNNVVEIGNYAFWECTGLQEITINENILCINEAVFGECSGHLIINNRYILEANLDESEYNDNVSINEYWLMDSKFNEITVGNNIENIISDAFFECNNVEKINLPNTVLTIGSGAFAGCSSLTDITLPSGLTFIDCELFAGCEKLKHIELPNSITGICCYAFAGCSNLESINIPVGVEYIDVGTFIVCSSLMEVNIPNTVYSIGGVAFEGCENLDTITLPESVNFLDYEVFWDCKNLRNIRCYSVNEPEINASTFDGAPEGGFLHIPVGADYSNWMSNESCFLGYLNWQTTNLFEPTVCYNLQISADDVKAKDTRTMIYWTCTADGMDPVTQTPFTNVTLTGKCYSESFEQNTSKTDTIERTITFEYMGLSASTVITQGVWKDNYYGYRHVFSPDYHGNSYNYYFNYPRCNNSDFYQVVDKVTFNGKDITDELNISDYSFEYYYTGDETVTNELLLYLKDDWYKIYDGSGQDIQLNIGFDRYELILNNLDVTPITNMEYMIGGWNYGDGVYNFGTQVLDLSNWDTSNVYTMNRMISQGEGPVDTIKKIILPPNFGSNCVDMEFVFWYTSGLKEINVENVNVSNAETIYGIFQYCSSLESLDLSMWDTSKVQNMGQVFHNCHSLKTLNVDGWNTSNVTDMSYMFNNCYSLTDIDLSTWDTSNVTNIDCMFAGCQSLTSLTMTHSIDKVSSINSSHRTLFDGVYTEGVFYFNPCYNYNVILNELPDNWRSLPILNPVDNVELETQYYLSEYYYDPTCIFAATQYIFYYVNEILGLEINFNNPIPYTLLPGCLLYININGEKQYVTAFGTETSENLILWTDLYILNIDMLGNDFVLTIYNRED